MAADNDAWRLAFFAAVFSGILRYTGFGVFFFRHGFPSSGRTAENCVRGTGISCRSPGRYDMMKRPHPAVRCFLCRDTNLNDVPSGPG